MYLGWSVRRGHLGVTTLALGAAAIMELYPLSLIRRLRCGVLVGSGWRARTDSSRAAPHR